MSKKGFGKFAIGAGIGAAITALFTTEKGKEYQVKISDLCEDIINKIKNMDAGEVKDNIEEKVKEIKAELADLDKEKAKDIALEKAKQLEEKTKDLAAYAKEKGTPVLEEMTENLRKEAVKATKKILEKLDKEEA
ncbi:MAG: YtxH domain-containing protein [Bacilli bacterium]|nr:YtxH domain-containing protein [Bacilli bacterium]